ASQRHLVIGAAVNVVEQERRQPTLCRPPKIVCRSNNHAALPPRRRFVQCTDSDGQRSPPGTNMLALHAGRTINVEAPCNAATPARDYPPRNPTASGLDLLRFHRHVEYIDDRG